LFAIDSHLITRRLINHKINYPKIPKIGKYLKRYIENEKKMILGLIVWIAVWYFTGYGGLGFVLGLIV